MLKVSALILAFLATWRFNCICLRTFRGLLPSSHQIDNGICAAADTGESTAA
jgi:hypothetical protein